MTPLEHVATSAEAELRAFLTNWRDTAMFPLVNLLSFGLGWTDAPRSCQFWVTRDQDNIRGALGLSKEGALFPVGDLSGTDLNLALDGHDVSMAFGEETVTRQSMDTLRMDRSDATLDACETHFVLHLADLTCSAMEDDMVVQPLAAMPKPQAIAWRAAYAIEVLGEVAGEAEARAAETIDSYLEKNSHRSLWHGGQPVAMSGFNASNEDTVQVGGVYTPPDNRGRGYARRVVGAHLAEARDNGATRALLFTNSANAERAYRSLGFGPIGQYRLTILKSAHRVTSL